MKLARTLQLRRDMAPIRDALELLTAQHEEIDALLARAIDTRDAHVFAELTDKLVHHLAIEQELFYPVIARYVSVGVLDEILAEHFTIKRVLADLQWLGIEAADPSGLALLAELVAGHTAWQEHELFEIAAEAIPVEDLAALGDRLHAFRPLAAAA